MVYLAVDKSGEEYIYDEEPSRSEDDFDESEGYWVVAGESDFIELPKGFIEKFLGYSLTWEDKPVYVADSE